MSKFAGIRFFLLLLILVGLSSSVLSQATPTPTSTPIPVLINRSSPSVVLNGEDVQVFGTNFTANSSVVLRAGGTDTSQATSYINDSELIFTANGIENTEYLVIVEDPDRASDTSPDTLTIIPPPTETPTPTATSTPQPYAITDTEPATMTSGRETTLSVIGTGFTAQTVVRLVGVGIIPTTFINSTSLNASVPIGLNPGTYSIVISDPARGDVTAPGTLTIQPAPTPTSFPTVTAVPPTPEPGSPLLILNSYNVNPDPIAPGGNATIQITVLNQGNRVAESVSASLDNSGALAPVSQQANVILPNLNPGAPYTFFIAAQVRPDAEGGTVSVPFTLNYRDTQNRTYSSQYTIAATITGRVEETLLTLSGYQIEPQPVAPGSPVTVSLLVTNSGTLPALQTVVTIPVGSSALLAGPRGNSFPIGQINPGETQTLRLPMRIASSATPGSQAQPVSIRYLQDGQEQQVEGSLTLDVDTPESTSILLSSYDTGHDTVQPGMQFTFNVTLQNIGAPAANALVTFEGEGGNNPFAPINGGGAVYLGDLPGGGSEVRATHDFLVSGDVTSGVYALPLTLSYTTQSGETAEDTFGASVVVLVPPRLRFAVEDPLPPTIRSGQNTSFAFRLVNSGQRPVELVGATLRTENAEIFSDEEIPLTTARPGEERFIEGSLVPDAAGEGTLIITVTYINDLNQEASIEQRYSFQVQARPTPAPPPDPATQPTPRPTPTPTPETLPDDFWSRLLLGLLGLGR
jgi:hypothetical protein